MVVCSAVITCLLPGRCVCAFVFLYPQYCSIYLTTVCLRLFAFAFDSNGTSMISLIIPPKDQISRVAKMLADEFGTASNIKSRVNRLSVLGAITSVQQRLKLYNKGMLGLEVSFPPPPIKILSKSIKLMKHSIKLCAITRFTLESVSHLGGFN